MLREGLCTGNPWAGSRAESQENLAKQRESVVSRRPINEERGLHSPKHRVRGGRNSSVDLGIVCVVGDGTGV